MEEDIQTKNIAHVPRQADDLSLVQYIYTTDIPVEMKERLDRIQMTFDKECALSNIKRYDIPGYLMQKQFIHLLLEMGLDDYADEEMTQMQEELKLTRGIDGLQLRSGLFGTSKSETIQRLDYNTQQRKSSKIGRLFGNKKPPISPNVGDVQ